MIASENGRQNLESSAVRFVSNARCNPFLENHASIHWGLVGPSLSSRRSLRHDVRVTGVAAGIEGAHPIAITRVTCQSSVEVTRDVCAHRGNQHEVHAVLTLATFDTEPGFII